MIGYRAIELGADTWFLGLLAAAFAAPAVIAALPFGKLAGWVGGGRVAFYGMVVMIAGTVAILWIPGKWLLLLSGAISGLGYLGAMIGHQTFVAQRSVGRAADRDFGTLATAASFGQLIGPPIVTMIVTMATPDTVHPNTSAGLIACIIGIAIGLPTWRWLRRVEKVGLARLRSSEEHSGEPKPERGWHVLSRPGFWRSLVASAAVLVTMDLGYAFLPAWATERGVDVAVVGWLLGIRAGVSALSRVGLSRLVDRFGRKPLLVVAMVLGVGALVALPLVDQVGAFVVMITLGITLGLPQPLTLAWIVDVTERSQHGIAVGLRMTSNRIAQLAVPIVMSAVAGSIGVAGIFWGNAILLAGAAAIVTRSDPDPGRARAQAPAS
jgi:MFS family permease